MEDVTRSCRDLNKLSAKGKIAFTMFLDECKRRGLNVLVTETYRSQERQNYLYEQGRTRPGKIVTYVRTTGYHGKGLAIDICENVKGHEYDNPEFFKKCYEVAKAYGIEWGGQCFGSFKDTPHFQIEANWEPPKAPITVAKVDEELSKAVSSIIKSGVDIQFNKWKRADLIELKNVPELLNRLGGIDNLVESGIINQKNIWCECKYSKQNVRSLLIKYSKARA